jgi:hypothetical protein
MNVKVKHLQCHPVITNPELEMLMSQSLCDGLFGFLDLVLIRSQVT